MDDRELVRRLVKLGVQSAEGAGDSFADPSSDPDLSRVGVATIAAWLEELGKLRLIGTVEPSLGSGSATLIYKTTREAQRLWKDQDALRTRLEPLFRTDMPDDDVATARSRWRAASEKASTLAAGLFRPGSGYGDPNERINDEQRLRAAQEEAQRLFREYEGVAALKGISVTGDPTTLKYDVFLSYASADSRIANELRDSLTEKKLSCFIAEKDIPAAADWSDVIRDAMHGSTYVLILMTQRSKERAWVLLEAGAAWALRKKIVPVCNQVETSDLPDPIRKYQARVVETSEERLRLAEEIAGA